MQRQEQKKYLEEILIFLEKKGKWIGDPIIILKYLNSNTKYLILFSKKSDTFFLNIDISESSFWSMSQCKENQLQKQLRYLANKFDQNKHIILLDNILFKKYYNIIGQF